MNCITNTEITRRLDHGERLTQMQGRYLALLQQGEPDQCAYCDIPLTDLNRTLDHIIPKAHRGTNHLDNLVLCCANCNRRKGAHTVTEFLDHWQSRITKGGGVLHAPSKPGQQRDGFSRQDEKPKKPKNPYLTPMAKGVGGYPVGEIARWDEGHAEARKSAGAEFHAAEVRRNRKGFPDP